MRPQVKVFKKLSLSLAVLLVGCAAQAATVNVVGNCYREVSPDRIYIVLTAVTLEKDASAAAKKVSAQYEDVRKEIKKMNLKNLRLQTASYTVNPEWDYSNNKRVLRGYSASMGLRIETSELVRVGEILSLSARLNVREVSSPTPFLSPALSQKESEECLSEAVQSARYKAEKMANAAKMKLSELESLSETRSDGGPRPMMYASDMATEKVSASVNYEVAPLSVSVSVNAVYGLK